MDIIFAWIPPRHRTSDKGLCARYLFWKVILGNKNEENRKGEKQPKGVSLSRQALRTGGHSAAGSHRGAAKTHLHPKIVGEGLLPWLPTSPGPGLPQDYAQTPQQLQVHTRPRTAGQAPPVIPH